MHNIGRKKTCSTTWLFASKNQYRQIPYASRTRRGQLEARSSKTRGEGDPHDQKYRPQNHTKSAKNRPQSGPWSGPEAPKSSQNYKKIEEKSILGARRSSVAVLGAFRARPGRVLARFGRRPGAQDDPKIDQKSMQKWIDFLMLLEIGFLTIFDRFWYPKWSQVGPKMGAKIDANFEERFL